MSFVEPHAYFCRGQHLRVCEFGFGFGLNLASLIRHLSRFVPSDTPQTIEYYCCDEKCFGPKLHREVLDSLGFFPHERDQFCELYEKSSLELISLRIKLHFFFGDVSDFLATIPKNIDIWLLDGHSPDKNPHMWSLEVFKTIKLRSSDFSTVSTYAASGLVKEGLRNAGFFVKRFKGFGSKRHRVFAIKNSCQHSNLRI